MMSPTSQFKTEQIFDIIPFHSGYHTLLGRTASTRFNAVLHYAYFKLKMPGPRGVITVNGNMERSLHTEEQTAAFAADLQAAEEAARRTTRQDPSGSSKRVRAITPALAKLV